VIKPARAPAWSIMLGGALLTLLVLPIATLVFTSSPSDIAAGLAHPLTSAALVLSFKTTLLSLAIVVLLGTPLAFWLARSAGRATAFVQAAIELPIVLPPAVLGVALLLAFGRAGVFGAVLERFGIALPFSVAAVVIAQVIVSAPFYVQAARVGFRAVDEDLTLVARTLGATPARVFTRITLPLASPGLLTGAALAWARALGEFGATLLFAGSLAGRTQTLPLAIYAALESDIAAARAIALVLCTIAFALLVLLRVLAARGSR
jgi:molybdate transport system permease protein